MIILSYICTTNTKADFENLQQELGNHTKSKKNQKSKKKPTNNAIENKEEKEKKEEKEFQKKLQEVSKKNSPANKKIKPYYSKNFLQQLKEEAEKYYSKDLLDKLEATNNHLTALNCQNLPVEENESESSEKLLNFIKTELKNNKNINLTTLPSKNTEEIIVALKIQYYELIVDLNKKPNKKEEIIKKSDNIDRIIVDFANKNLPHKVSDFIEIIKFYNDIFWKYVKFYQEIQNKYLETYNKNEKIVENLYNFNHIRTMFENVNLTQGEINSTFDNYLNNLKKQNISKNFILFLRDTLHEMSSGRRKQYTKNFYNIFYIIYQKTYDRNVSKNDNPSYKELEELFQSCYKSPTYQQLGKHTKKQISALEAEMEEKREKDKLNREKDKLNQEKDKLAKENQEKLHKLVNEISNFETFLYEAESNRRPLQARDMNTLNKITKNKIQQKDK
jgi:hypothetical protein